MAGTLVANTINTDTGLFSTNNAYSGIAKAWAYFNGSTSTVINSFNVSSVTKNSTGIYTVNFATAMPNANYSTNVSGLSASSSDGRAAYFVNGAAFSTGPTSQTTSGIRVSSHDASVTGWPPIDTVAMYVAVFSS